MQGREMEASHRKSDLEKQLELAEAETLTGLYCTAINRISLSPLAVRGELKTALKRVEDLQVAISGDIDSDSYSDQVECGEIAMTDSDILADNLVVCLHTG